MNVTISVFMASVKEFFANCLAAFIGGGLFLFALIYNVFKFANYCVPKLRFDGKLGFPGGLVEPGEDIVAGLNRELVEEINLDITKHSIKEEDFVFCHYIPSEDDQTKSSRIRIFFAKEVTKSDFEIIEKRSLDAKEFGYEVGIYILYSILEYISSF